MNAILHILCGQLHFLHSMLGNLALWKATISSAAPIERLKTTRTRYIVTVRFTAGQYSWRLERQPPEEAKLLGVLVQYQKHN